MTLKRLRGTEDLSPENKKTHNWIIQQAREAAERFCFQEVATPILEYTDIFARSLGADSDIVYKEMFSFKDRNGEGITLRPEGTACMARHFITEKRQHDLPLRWFYHGPMFRYERPQKGRLRQFHTIGMELLGEAEPRGDLEGISLAWLFLKKLGVEKKIQIEINSIGDQETRLAHKTALIKYLQPLRKKLSEESQKRLKKNPLRILDSKEPEDQEIIRQIPLIKDFLNDNSRAFFQTITNGLNDMEIPWKSNPTLVRGLDYYTHCVFECKSDSDKLGAQNTVLAGGRYDQLIETLAGPEHRTPGLGWAAGIERLSLLLNSPPTASLHPIALIPLGEVAENQAIQMAWKLRQEGFCVFHPKSQGNLSKKMKRANQVQAQLALIFGPEEIKKEEVSAKDMDTGVQKSLPLAHLLNFLKDQYKNGPSHK